MADNQKQDLKAEAAQHLGTGAPAATIDGALGPNWEKWQKHVVAHVQLPDDDKDGEVQPETPVVPLLAYGDGPNDYIATDIDAGQVMVRDGNDRTGKAWKWPLDAFLRFVAHSQGKKVAGEPEAERGDNPYVAAAKQNERTARIVEAERNESKDNARKAEQDGRASQSRTGR